VAEGRFYGISHAPSQEWGPSAPKIFVIPTYTYTYTFRPRENKLGTYSTHRGGACFQSATQAPISKGRALANPNFWHLQHHAHMMTYSSQILHADQTGQRDNFIGSTTPTAWPKFFVTQMLTRDLLLIANLFVRYHFYRGSACTTSLPRRARY